MSDRLQQRWPQVEALLDSVLDQPRDQREGWLQRHCEDAELRALVLSMLAADDACGERIDAQVDVARAWADMDVAALTEFPAVPGYRILELLGEGGMASVFLAERDLQGVNQTVALKRLRLSVYDPGERQRFLHEQRILARLEHPNIARLIDAGIAPDGVPWFAMEHVEGEPLVAWCDARRLGIDARLGMFADACAAVHYAHQHLVVHRDLKPNNILVGGGTVKLLDFGIAKLLDPDNAAAEPTRTELRRLTPAYAAPEQFTGHASTASDIYALGVILVELVGGARPAAVAGHGDDASDRLRSMAISGDSAAARASTPRALGRVLAGDLGAIARKAMRVEPELRYGSAQALAEDIGRWRERRPVVARRGDWRYRAGCFVRRNKAAVAASMLIATTLVVATGVSVTQARRATLQAERAQATQDFLAGLLAPLVQGVVKDRMPTLDTLVDRGVAQLARSAETDPAVHADLLGLFADSYQAMGQPDKALALSERAYATGVLAYGRDSPQALEALARRGQRRLEANKLEAGSADVEAAAAAMRRRGIRGLPWASALDGLAVLQLQRDRFDFEGARRYRLQALRERERVLGPDRPELSDDHYAVGQLDISRGQPQAALASFRTALRLHGSGGRGEDRWGATLLAAIARVQCQLSDWLACRRDYDRAVTLFARIGDRDHPLRQEVYRSACGQLTQLGDREHAAGYCTRSVEMAERLYGRDSRVHADAVMLQGGLQLVGGQLAQARATLRRAGAIYAGLDGAAYRPLALDVMLGWMSLLEGDADTARDHLLRLSRESRLDWSMWAASELAWACTQAPHPDCPPDLAAGLDRQLAQGRITLQERAWVQLVLARRALFLRRPSEVLRRIADVRASIAGAKRGLRPDRFFWQQAGLLEGQALVLQGHRAEAATVLQAVAPGITRRWPDGHPYRRELADALRAAGSG